MDEVTAFDRQIAGEVLREAGPSELVDGAAIFAAITTSQSLTWRFQSMFSATRFGVAVAVVALFGGFLLSSVLTTQPDEVAPAAVTASPSPPSTDDLLSGFETEEVEPGVLRVVNDGVRDLTRRIGDNSTFNPVHVVAGTDGRVWQIDRDQLINLGDDSVHPWPDDIPELARDEEFTLGADGVLWLTVPKARPSSFGPARSSWRFDGESWENSTVKPGSYAVEAHPNGATYALTPIGVHLLDDGAPTLVSPLRDHGEYPGAPDGLDLRITDDGALWLVPENELEFYRDGGSGWERIDDAGLWAQLPPAFSSVGIAWVRGDVSPSGTIWAYIAAGTPPVITGETPIDYELARFDGSEWLAWGLADGVPGFMFNGIEDSLVASADDSVWGIPAGWDADGELQCAGIVNFDGATWTHYLEGSCVHDFDIALDGTAWLLAGDTSDPANDPVSVYVIRPPQATE